MPSSWNLDYLSKSCAIKVFSAGDSADVRGRSPQKHGEFTTRFRWRIEECWKPEPAMRSAPRDCLYDR